MTSNLRAGWAVVVLFVTCMAFAIAAVFIASAEIHSDDRKWCGTLDLLLEHRPPAGSAAANPSRAYEQHLYAAFEKRARSLGC